MAFARSAELSHRLVFLENFDIAMDHWLSQGVDVWLNTPRRPDEACGIAGMKAGINGALNFSTVDGWWDEAWQGARPGRPPVGWAIGGRRTYADTAEQDADDAASFYDVLEHEIIPTFYDRDANGLPRRWLASVRESIAVLGGIWSSARMVEEYTSHFYVPGTQRAAQLSGRRASRARDAAAFLERLHSAWPRVGVGPVTVTREANGKVRVRADVDLGDLASTRRPRATLDRPRGRRRRSGTAADARPLPRQRHTQLRDPRGRRAGAERHRVRYPRRPAPRVGRRSVVDRSRHVVGLTGVGDETAVLRELARAHGVETGYHDVSGEYHEASDETLVAVLQSLGAGVEHPADAPDALARHCDEKTRQMLPPVVASWDEDEPAAVWLRTRARDASRVVECGVRLEDGGSFGWRARIADLPIGDSPPSGRAEWTARRLTVPEQLPFGVHQLRAVVGDRAHLTRVIVAPRRGAASGPVATTRSWGAFLPLYSLQSERSIASGDLGDFSDLAAIVAEQGGTVVATLPLLASFLDEPCETSPYNPVSRRFWNELYIDIERVPELRWSPEAAARLGSSAFAAETPRAARRSVAPASPGRRAASRDPRAAGAFDRDRSTGSARRVPELPRRESRGREVRALPRDRRALRDRLAGMAGADA